jgi:hypothetical protein
LFVAAFPTFVSCSCVPLDYCHQVAIQVRWRLASPRLGTHIQTGHRRIVIRHLRSKLRPCIHVNVLVLDLLRNRLRQIHVVELLRVHVEQVRVPLQLVDLICGICVLQPRDLSILLQRLDKGKLARVSTWRCADLYSKLKYD